MSEYCRGYRDADIRADHSDHGNKPQGTSSNAVCETGAEDADKEIPDLHPAVDSRLLISASYVERREKRGEIV